MIHDLFEKLVGQAIYMYVWFVNGGTASVIVSQYSGSLEGEGG